jgi:Fe-S cluster assembly protein SufD
MTSFDLKDFPVPSGREEEWRFTPVREFSPLFETGHNSEAITMDVSLAPEVKAEVVPADDPRLGQTGAPGDRAAAAGWSAAGQAVVVTILHGTTASEPTNLSIRALARDAAAVKILIHAETGSKGVVIIDHSGNGIVNETVEIVVDDEAELTVVAVQDWESGESSPDGRLRAGAIHASSHRSIVGENAKLKHVVVTLGGQAVRVTPDVKFTKSNGDAQLLGLYFADAGQYMEHRLFVDHSVRSCKSRVTYKGALQGANAHTVWVGDVFIGAEATETDTYELNRNLVLTKGARADSVPNLEIETGEIAGAGHASATGRFDDQQLFYLMARGIPAAEARRLVVRGFFAELISSIGVAHVEERLMTAIEAELNKTATAELAGKGGQD